jgi:hypothetical protein
MGLVQKQKKSELLFFIRLEYKRKSPSGGTYNPPADLLGPVLNDEPANHKIQTSRRIIYMGRKPR